MSRLSRVNAFLETAKIMARRSTCSRAQVGCVVVDEQQRIVGVGYNGNPPSLPHCIDGSCFTIDGHCITTTHAEINAIQRLGPGCYAAYCTHSPCLTCLKVGVNIGVHTYIFLTHYEDLLRDTFIQWYNTNRKEGEVIIKLYQVELYEDTYSLVGETEESGMFRMYPERKGSDCLLTRSRKTKSSDYAGWGSTRV